MIDIKKVTEDAEKEFQQEREVRAKNLIKAKLKVLSDAKKIVKNIERELEDLYADINEQA